MHVPGLEFKTKRPVDTEFPIRFQQDLHLPPNEMIWIKVSLQVWTYPWDVVSRARNNTPNFQRSGERNMSALRGCDAGHRQGWRGGDGATFLSDSCPQALDHMSAECDCHWSSQKPRWGTVKSRQKAWFWKPESKTKSCLCCLVTVWSWQVIQPLPPLFPRQYSEPSKSLYPERM